MFFTSLNLRQHVLKDLIVMLHTIVQIKLNHLIGQRVNFFLILMQLSVLRLHFVQLLGQLDTLAGAGGSGHLFFQTFDGSTVARLLLVDIIGADARNGIRLVAVQVDQALEAIFLTAVKQPVDRTLAGAGNRIGLAVILEEIVQKIVPDDLPAGAALIAEGFCDIVEVCFQRIGTVLLFFLKQKTAYAIETGDWSSDVCSSDMYRELFHIHLFAF